MRAHNNGTPSQCANNLLKITRGEVPYERIKGLDPRMVDRPILTADLLLRQDADWLIETYEPRAEIKALRIVPSDSASGGYSIIADIEEKGE